MTNDARRGYSHRLVQIVSKRDQKDPAVRFAQYCIAREIPALEVAKLFGVTKAAVYYWFKGEWRPREHHVAKMLEIMASGSA